ncbi:MAG: fumarylacetoacetate hydrolase family protein, partial [Caldiserica bacterium]|nr:fumarylacetoacetate hydrolase family protein [Caldisericota bacterium]
MRVASFESKGIEKVGVFYKGKLIDIDLVSEIIGHKLDKEFPAFFNVVDIIEQWEYVEKLIEKGEKLFKSEFLKFFEVKNPLLTAPIIRESKIVCLGKNYAEHAKETGSKPPEEPIIFGKFADCVISHDEEIIYPDFATRVDPEVELAVVIGKQGKDVDAEEAMDYVFGYTIANDITERELEYADMKKGWPWFRSKNFDAAMPLGPWIVTKDEIPNPHNLEIELSVNGKVRQKGNTKDMIF